MPIGPAFCEGAQREKSKIVAGTTFSMPIGHSKSETGAQANIGIHVSRIFQTAIPCVESLHTVFP
jgi:hypothetical protein